MTFVHRSLCCALMLAPAPQSQTISARGGDLVVVSPTAAVRVVRRGDAKVRAIMTATVSFQ